MNPSGKFKVALFYGACWDRRKKKISAISHQWVWLTFLFSKGEIIIKTSYVAI
jgi:hypothetical protein